MATHYGAFDESEGYCPLDEKLGPPTAFSFPDRCCRCLAPSPTKEWRASSFGKQVEGTNVHVSFHLQVPVCSDCWSRLRRTQIQQTVATAFVAVLAAIGLWYADPFDNRHAELNDVFMVWALAALFLSTASIGVYYTLGAIFVPRNLRGVAYLNRDGNKLTFFNPEYQRLFENHFPPAESPDPSYHAVGDEPARW